MSIPHFTVAVPALHSLASSIAGRLFIYSMNAELYLPVTLRPEFVAPINCNNRLTSCFQKGRKEFLVFCTVLENQVLL
ncbi:hypothetical protein TIFTF001_036529 [Ficus carica]|uniref:Uncharacterized protein n=1 Tax=Ficus carica TaxID=3494 RepID=A0AA88E5F9_FICCA|nr:hypothetical protein TIFTF001_036529 [Ficus carica]